MEHGITGKPGTKIAVEHEHFRGGVRVLLWNEESYYRCSFEQVPHDDTMSTPRDESFLRVSVEEAQALCQALSDAGFKPEGGSGGPAHIEAIQQNANDLRMMLSIEGSHIARLFMLLGVKPAEPKPSTEDDGKQKDSTDEDT